MKGAPACVRGGAAAAPLLFNIAMLQSWVLNVVAGDTSQVNIAPDQDVPMSLLAGASNDGWFSVEAIC